MSAVSSGSQPKIRVDRTEIDVSPLASGPVREEILIMNEGKGRLYGNIRSDAPWVTVLDTNLNTPLVQRIILQIRPEKAPSGGESWVHILSTGGIARVKVKLKRSPVPVSTLKLDEKNFQFCGITKDEILSFSLTIRNTGPGFLSGTAVPLNDWIEVPVRGIWTKTVQVIQIVVHSSKAPQARHPIGRIQIRTNGGEETVEVSLHRSPEKGPVAKFTPSSIRISWSVRGIIEERLVIRNIGTGTLRGTIPSKYPWVTAIPSIFSVQDVAIITIRADTRLLPGTVPASVPLGIVTNAGLYTINLEITKALQTPVKPRIHLPRIKTRSRMTVLDEKGSPLQIISSGKSGGEGEIWYVEGDDHRCVKVFHPHRSCPEMEEKIRAMQNSPLKTPPGTGMCWPTGVITSASSQSRFMGYVMTRLDERYTPVHTWYDKPVQDFSFCLKSAGRLARIVDVVHSSGHCIGDLRENNVFISASGDICLIDTDSFQITDPLSSKTWFCRVGTGEYLPPELIDGSFEKEDIDRLFADRFALAVLIFRFLMQGAHPYQARGPLIEDAPTTPDKILRGLFAYEKKIPGLYPPEYAPPYDRIPGPIRALFREAFVIGHQHPQARPEPSRWISVLDTCLPHHNSPVVFAVTQPSALVFPVQEISKPPEFVDELGSVLEVKDRLVRIHHGEIRQTNRPGYSLLVGWESYSPLSSLKDMKLPPSVIVPVMMVHQNTKAGKAIRYLIPDVDFSRFVHWHDAADPTSRMKWKGKKFSFRHRVAVCRNLLSTLISIFRAGLVPFSLSPRSVFVGPDSSVRVFAVPKRSQSFDHPDDTWILHIQNLLCMMLMDGYMLYHLDKSKSSKHHLSYIPHSGVIPYPMRRVFSTRLTELQPSFHSIETSLHDWFSCAEMALYSLVSCPVDPDHWFCILPGTCPFCQKNQHDVLQLSSGPVFYRISCSPVFLLSAPVQMVRYITQRRILPERLSIPIIFLPSCVKLPYLLSGTRIFQLVSRNSPASFIPVRWQRFLPAIIPVTSTALVVIPPPRPLPDVIHVLLDISLIDEMRWVASLEQMKALFLPRLIVPKRNRRQYVRKNYSVMIYPGFFGSLEKPSMEKPKKRKKEIKEKSKSAKSGKKGGKLTKKLSDFIEEYFG